MLMLIVSQDGLFPSFIVFHHFSKCKNTTISAGKTPCGLLFFLFFQKKTKKGGAFLVTNRRVTHVIRQVAK